VFVTHDVDEAIFLSDRIALFGTNPGRILDVLDVNIPRPRADLDVVSLPAAIELRKHIVSRLNTKGQVFV
jgi:NitT/TauT family transport system ATP-binding protein